MLKIFKTLCLALLLAGGSSVAQAATLSDIVGDVKVNKGGGFQVAKAGVVVNPGDKVMTAQGASARIVYNEQLAVLVRSGQLRVVSTEKMIRIRAGAKTVGGEGAAAGAAAAGAGSGLAVWVPVVVGIGVVGGVAAVAISRSNDSAASGQ